MVHLMQDDSSGVGLSNRGARSLQGPPTAAMFATSSAFHQVVKGASQRAESGRAGQPDPSQRQFGSTIPNQGENAPSLVRGADAGASFLAWHHWRARVHSLFFICATACFVSEISLGRVRLSRLPTYKDSTARLVTV